MKKLEFSKYTKVGADYNEDDLTLHNYKEPLTKVEGGFGFYGTLISTKDGNYIQCHICGKLVQHLASHAFMGHKVKSREYKERFGLAYTTALISETERNRLKQATLDYIKGLTEEEKREFSERRRLAWARMLRNRNKAGQPLKTLETANKRGTCPDQLLEEIKKVKEALGRTPSKKEFIAHVGTQRHVHLIYKVFGSWKAALEILGMEQKKKTHKGFRRKQYTDEELLNYLKVFYKTNGKIPTQTDFYRNLLPSYGTYTRRYGSISNARALAYLLLITST